MEEIMLLGAHMALTGVAAVTTDVVVVVVTMVF